MDYDRHLISRHGYDYCKICYLIGPWSSVGLHITKKHSDRVCSTYKRKILRDIHYHYSIIKDIFQIMI